MLVAAIYLPLIHVFNIICFSVFNKKTNKNIIVRSAFHNYSDIQSLLVYQSETNEPL